MGTESKYYREVINKLERLCKKKHFSFILMGFAVLFLSVTAFIILSSFIELISNFNSSVRTIIFMVGCLLAALLTVISIFIPLVRYFNFLRKETYFQVADEVGKSFPPIKDELLNSMQLVSTEENKNFYSPEMINAAFKNVYNKTKNISFESIVKFDKVKRIYSLLAYMVILFLLLILFVPGLNAASYRLLNFNKEYITTPLFSFNISPGNSDITKGDDIMISVSADGKAPDYILLGIKNEGEVEFKFEKLSTDSSDKYEKNLKAIRTSFKYFATAENINSDEFEIKVVDRPIVENLVLQILPPAYSKSEKIVQRDNGNVTALVGTEVFVNISSTKELSKSLIIFSDTTSIDLVTDGKEAGGKFIVRKNKSYIIKLFDKSGTENSSPILYNVQAMYDKFPSITMIAPNKNIKLANDNRVNLITDINDDYGFSKLILNYRLSESRYEVVQPEFSHLQINIQQLQKQQRVDYIWNLSLMSLGTDDVVSYYLEVFDNDKISGPKSSKTPIFNVMVPSLDEILADAEETQDFVQDELEQVLREAEDLQKTLEEIDQDLKKDEIKISWEEKEKIENALDKFQELQEKVNNLSDELQKMQSDLHENDLLSQETLEKYMELQELMDELTSEVMKKAIERLQQQMEQMNRKMTQDQIENFKIDEERFKKSIERTLNLLKRIQVEQKVDEIIKRTEELIENQNDLRGQTQDNDPLTGNKNELMERQNDITDKIDRLEGEMEELDSKMSEIDDMPEEELEKVMDKMEEQQNKKMSETASQNIRQNDMEQALQQQQQIKNNMDELNRQMQEMQNSMKMQNLMQTFTDMMRMLDNIIEMSKMQEELKSKTEGMESGSSSFNGEAEKQEVLKENLLNIMKQMAELSQKTFAITPEMGKALGNAVKQMQQTIQSLQNRNGSIAALSQTEAMKNLNEAASMLKGMMETLMQGGGGGGGMMSLMQQLQQLSAQQMDLNRLTQMLQQLQQGNLTPQQQHELQRLAQQQDLIRKSLEQLNHEAKLSGESKKIPADLDNVLNQMQEVLTNMNSQKLDDGLIQKQERILSKLLDTQRSINERDFEKERKSNTGINVVRESPGGINLDSEEGKDKLNDEIDRTVKEGYAKDYEELILKYFEAVKETDSNK
ncbi:MAG: hypothetical protein PVF17_10710 [Ignavibacteria bacterium]|jgi:hypothetical protein